MGNLFSSLESPIKDKYYAAFVKDMPSQQGKVVAITGTTSGTGFEAAKAIVSKGGKVLCLNRASERANSSLAALKDACADGGSVDSVACDLQDFASVRSAAVDVRKHVQSTGLNALVNNAGVMALPEKTTRDGYDVQMQTNHLSHFLLTSLLMPELEKAATTSGDARVVNHSSGARNMGKAMGEITPSPLEEKYMEPLEGEGLGGDDQGARMKRYQQSKLANTVFTLALKEKLSAKGSKVKSLVAHPGVSMTSLGANTLSHGPGSGLDNKLALRVFKLFMQGQGDGSLPLLAATVNPDAASGDFYVPGNVGVMGGAMKDTMTGPPKKMDWEARAELEKYSTDPSMHSLLWACSEKATGTSFSL